eukprot:4127657-Pleurochrysis_carterae.AAC.1
MPMPFPASNNENIARTTNAIVIPCITSRPDCARRPGQPRPSHALCLVLEADTRLERTLRTT